MKRVLFATLVLLGFSVAGFSQTTPVKKNESSTTQAIKKSTSKKEQAGVVMHKAAKPATPTIAKTSSAKAGTQKQLAKTKSAAKPATTTAALTKKSASAPLKKDGTPDKRYKANKKKN
jgi:colicin import membrane protein